MERGRRRPRRLLRPPADRSGAAHRHLGAGVGAHAEPHPPQPLQQRRRHAPPRRQPLRILRDDRVSRRLGAAGRAHTRSVGRASRPRPTRASSPIRGVATAAARAADMAAGAAALLAWCRARDKADVVRILTPLGCPVGAYAQPSDLLSSAQLAHRGFFREIDDGRGGRVRIPGPPYQLSATPAAVGSAPALGSSSGFARPASRTRRSRPGVASKACACLDFTWAAAGPYATCLLALLGADVVKVESTRRPDPARRGFLADYGGINRSPNFNEINLGKRSFQVDLSQPDGLDLAHRLVDWADVVVDNFRPGVMDRFGLGAAALLERRPDVLVVSSSANGSTGPDAPRRRAGEHLRRDRRDVGADRLRRRTADRDRRVDRLPQRQRDGGRDLRRAAPPGADRAGSAHRPRVARGRRRQRAGRAPGGPARCRLGRPHRERAPRDVPARRLPRCR